MPLQKRSLGDRAMLIGLAPILALIYLGCLIHLSYLYARMLIGNFGPSPDARGHLNGQSVLSNMRNGVG
jgi:hypothetical protein